MFPYAGDLSKGILKRKEQTGTCQNSNYFTCTIT